MWAAPLHLSLPIPRRLFSGYYIMNVIIILSYYFVRDAFPKETLIQQTDDFGSSREFQIIFFLCVLLAIQYTRSPTLDAFLATAFIYIKTSIMFALAASNLRATAWFAVMVVVVYVACPQPSLLGLSKVKQFTKRSFEEDVLMNNINQRNKKSSSSSSSSSSSTTNNSTINNKIKSTPSPNEINSYNINSNNSIYHQNNDFDSNLSFMKNPTMVNNHSSSDMNINMNIKPTENNHSFSNFWLVYFCSASSSACVHLAPVFADLSMTHQCSNLRFGKLDVDKWPSISSKYSLDQNNPHRHLPTIILFSNGKEKRRLPSLGVNGQPLGQPSFSKADIATYFDLDSIKQQCLEQQERQQSLSSSSSLSSYSQSYPQQYYNTFSSYQSHFQLESQRMKEIEEEEQIQTHYMPLNSFATSPLSPTTTTILPTTSISSSSSSSSSSTTTPMTFSFSSLNLPNTPLSSSSTSSLTCSTASSFQNCDRKVTKSLTGKTNAKRSKKRY